MKASRLTVCGSFERFVITNTDFSFSNSLRKKLNSFQRDAAVFREAIPYLEKANTSLFNNSVWRDPDFTAGHSLRLVTFRNDL